MKSLLRISALALVAALGASAHAAFTPYERDLAGFTAAGGAGIAVDFDAYADETAFEGAFAAGATFHGVSSPNSPLTVVNAADTFTPGGSASNRLFATSGTKVLSPGGKSLGFDASEQFDGLEITFAQPTQTFGLDLLFQSDDGFSLAGITLYDAQNNVIYANGFLPTGGNGGGGSEFYGYIADTASIARVVISDDDNDATNPDANLGYDSIRFTPVPEPSTWAALSLGTLAVFRRRR